MKFPYFLDIFERFVYFLHKAIGVIYCKKKKSFLGFNSSYERIEEWKGGEEFLNYKNQNIKNKDFFLDASYKESPNTNQSNDRCSDGT